jgi:hypothetical protein
VYPGVTAGTCYLIFPKQRFKEMVHHDLRIDIGPADISRLIEGQQVGVHGAVCTRTSPTRSRRSRFRSET